MALNSGPNQAKAYALVVANLNAALTLVTAEVATAQAAYNASPTAVNGAILAAVQAEQTAVNYQISLLTPNSVSGTATEGWQEYETAPYQPAWFPR